LICSDHYEHFKIKTFLCYLARRLVLPSCTCISHLFTILLLYIACSTLYVVFNQWKFKLMSADYIHFVNTFTWKGANWGLTRHSKNGMPYICSIKADATLSSLKFKNNELLKNNCFKYNIKMHFERKFKSTWRMITDN